MRAPRFKPVKTEKGWRLNIPRALSTSGKRSRWFFASREAADGAATKLRAQVVSHGMDSRILPPAQAESAARAFAILGEGVGSEDLINAAREYAERHDRRLASLLF